MRRSLTLFLASAALAVVSPAWAHVDLVSTNPASGSTVTEPITVALTFSEPPLVDGTAVVFVDASGATHDARVSVTGSEVDAQWPAAVSAGALAINWRVTADDGHVIQGTLPLAFAPEVTGNPSAQPVASSVNPTPVVIATMSPMPLGPSPSQPDLTWWILGCVLLVTGGVMVYLFSARRR